MNWIIGTISSLSQIESFLKISVSGPKSSLEMQILGQNAMICPYCRDKLRIMDLIGEVKVQCFSCERWSSVSNRPVSHNLKQSQSDCDLIVDLQNSFVSYKGRQIRTKPPDNLQNQHLFAFYILARNTGSFLSTGEIWERLEEEDLLEFLNGKRSTQDLAPEEKYIRYGILKVIKKAFADQPDNGIDHLIETQPNPKPARLRLNLPPDKVLCIGLKESTS